MTHPVPHQLLVNTSDGSVIEMRIPALNAADAVRIVADQLAQNRITNHHGETITGTVTHVLARRLAT